MMEQVKWTVSDEDFKFAEKQVRTYPKLKKQLEDMANDFRLATPVHDDNGGGRSNIPSNPTERTVIAILNDARINHLQTWIDAVEVAFRELDDDKQRFVRQAYWECDSNASWKEKAIRCSLTYPTLNRWRRGFILRVCQEAGVR